MTPEQIEVAARKLCAKWYHMDEPTNGWVDIAKQHVISDEETRALYRDSDQQDIADAIKYALEQK